MNCVIVNSIIIYFVHLFILPVTVNVQGGKAGRDGADDGRNHSRHSVQVMNSASVVDAQLLVHQRLLLRNYQINY